tara:strand:- start:4434 stop:5246 length:813 start_codon:yes stop_codon:yes gene_type:complete
MFVVKVPRVNNLNKIDGFKNSGELIIKELRNIKVNEQGKLVDPNLLDLEEIHLDNSNPKYSNELIYKNSSEIFEKKPRVIFLGGDNSISYSTGKAFLKHCNENEKQPCLIVFSSHCNCFDLEDEETPISEAWLKSLIDKGFPKENILLVGIRNFNLNEVGFLKNNNIKLISMNFLLEDLQEICDTIMEFSNGKELYVSIDISVIDPVFAPSTICKEIGGLTSRQFLYLIQRINKMNNLRAVDLVNINAEEDIKNNNLTIKLGAKILSELL